MQKKRRTRHDMCVPGRIRLLEYCIPVPWWSCKDDRAPSGPGSVVNRPYFPISKMAPCATRFRNRLDRSIEKVQSVAYFRVFSVVVIQVVCLLRAFAGDQTPSPPQSLQRMNVLLARSYASASYRPSEQFVSASPRVSGTAIISRRPPALRAALTRFVGRQPPRCPGRSRSAPRWSSAAPRGPRNRG